MTRRNNNLNVTWDHPRRCLKLAASGTLTIIILAAVVVICFYLSLHHLYPVGK
jgi:hypothetical protein